MNKNNIRQGPHKFQHLAKQAGTPMEAISEALTRSDSVQLEFMSMLLPEQMHCLSCHLVTAQTLT